MKISFCCSLCKHRWARGKHSGPQSQRKDDFFLLSLSISSGKLNSIYSINLQPPDGNNFVLLLSLCYPSSFVLRSDPSAIRSRFSTQVIFQNSIILYHSSLQRLRTYLIGGSRMLSLPAIYHSLLPKLKIDMIMDYSSNLNKLC